MLKGIFTTLHSALNYFLHNGIPCILHTTTGIYCPGCGGTRSLIALLTGHPIKSLLLHPIVIILIVELIALFVRRVRIGRFFIHKWEVVMILTILTVQWIAKDVLLLFGIDIIETVWKMPLP